MMNLDVRVELNAAAKRIPALRSRISAFAANALNAAGTAARRAGIADTAKALRLPANLVAKKQSRKGGFRDRVQLRRASRNNLQVVLPTALGGLSVTRIATGVDKRPGGGIKARGGRFYKGAFMNRKGVVLKRRGSERLPIFAPNLILYKPLQRSMERALGTVGRKRFVDHLNARVAKELARG